MESILFWGATKGKGSGIGESLTKSLAKSSTESKYSLILAGRNREKLENLSKKTDSSIFVADFPIDSAKYTKVLQAHSVKTVVSFIGVGFGESLPFIDDASIAEMVQSNLVVNIDIVKKSINYLKNVKGNIILANSIVGTIPTEGSSVYTATKFALRGFIESLRSEIASYGIGISCLYFQNIHKTGFLPIKDCFEVALQNKTTNLDFIIN